MQALLRTTMAVALLAAGNAKAQDADDISYWHQRAEEKRELKERLREIEYRQRQLEYEQRIRELENFGGPLFNKDWLKR